jgi:FkbM family methyltransferase
MPLQPRTTLRRLVRGLGFDVVRYPNPGGLAFPHLVTVLAEYGIDCVLDVGAHWGEFGSRLRQMGYRGDIVSFEPVAESFARLEQLAAPDPRWSVHRFALGNRDASAEINVSHESDLSSFLETSSYGHELFPTATEVDSAEVVQVRRLDSILATVVDGGSSHLFLKCDTQGWDLEVISGADGCLDRIQGLQIEAAVKPIYNGAPSYLDALAEVTRRGFALTGIFPIQRDEQLQIVELDCIFVRAQRPD